MAEHPPEQERAREIAEAYARAAERRSGPSGASLTRDMPWVNARKLARAYLALLEDYEELKANLFQAERDALAESEELIKRLEDRSAAFERAVADCVRLEKALRATSGLAAVANEGDPWYAEHEGLDAEAILAQARDALAATPKLVVEEESARE